MKTSRRPRRATTIAVAASLTLTIAAVPSTANAAAGQVTNKRACIAPGVCRPINTQSSNPAIIVECKWENPIAGYAYPYSYRSCTRWVSNF